MSEEQGRKRATLTIAVVIVAAIFGYLLFGGLDKNVVFFLTPAELLAKGTDGMGVPIRLGGQVQPGSVQWDAEKIELRFQVTDTTGKIVRVSSRTAPPQMFRDGMGVVVEGRYNRDGVFEAKSLMVKHSNEYRAPKPGEMPSAMYKSLMKGGKTP
jgi:cytochrome c-type biogenesis protein CcmE